MSPNPEPEKGIHDKKKKNQILDYAKNLVQVIYYLKKKQTVVFVSGGGPGSAQMFGRNFKKKKKVCLQKAACLKDADLTVKCSFPLALRCCSGAQGSHLTRTLTALLVLPSALS